MVIRYRYYKFTLREYAIVKIQIGIGIKKGFNLTK